MFESLLERGFMGKRLLANGLDFRLFVTIVIIGMIGIIALFIFSLRVREEINRNE